eukprot:XP_001198807.2 PREDICTED: uncharacterized protein LOC762976 [Strongylocentrotus purpuratus]
MLFRTWSSVILVFILYVCLLDATENEGDIKKRGAGTERTGTLALRTGSTGPTTPATPTCKVSSLTLVGDDSYYYACCEGTTITGPTEVVNWDCDPARKTYATLNESKAFYCGGITGELNARKRCDERWKWLTSESCFKWTECFLGVCPFEAEKRGSSVDASFCGDGQCDDATETPEGCPADCCGMINDNCLATNNTCPDPCCSTPSCCKASFGALDTSQVWLIIIVSVVGSILLINFVCCCCCFCCFRKCCGNKNNGSNAVV